MEKIEGLAFLKKIILGDQGREGNGHMGVGRDDGIPGLLMLAIHGTLVILSSLWSLRLGVTAGMVSLHGLIDLMTFSKGKAAAQRIQDRHD